MLMPLRCHFLFICRVLLLEPRGASAREAAEAMRAVKAGDSAMRRALGARRVREAEMR